MKELAFEGLSLKAPSALKDNFLEILYQDNHLLVVNKTGGLLVQGDRTGDLSIVEWAKGYIKEKYHKPGNVYLGLVHRLDRVTSGVVVFARTSKAAARLSQAFREKQIRKIYLAVIHGVLRRATAELRHYLVWDKKKRRAQALTHPQPEAKEAILLYQTLKTLKGKTLLQIELLTGRKHQIRAQLAAMGHPIVGDFKYGSRKKVFSGRAILLHAWQITLPHPTRRNEMTFEAPLPDYWPEEFRPVGP